MLGHQSGEEKCRGQSGVSGILTANFVRQIVDENEHPHAGNTVTDVVKELGKGHDDVPPKDLYALYTSHPVVCQPKNFQKKARRFHE